MAREPNMQRARRNSLFTRGGRAEKCSDEIFYCMGALLTIATYDSATQSQSATLNLRVEVTDSFRDWIRFLLLLLLIYMSKAHPLLSDQNELARLCPPAITHYTRHNPQLSATPARKSACLLGKARVIMEAH